MLYTKIIQFVDSRFHFIKVDVEGMENKVLNGGTRVLTEDRPIVYIEHIKSNPDELKAIFHKHNYTVNDFDICNFLAMPN